MKANLRRHLPSATFALVLLLVLAGFAGAYIYVGAYNVAADAPHSTLVYRTLDELRERSIAARSRGIRAPADLGARKRIAAGAGLYDDMCAACHLGPGVERSELSQGLYPQAPELNRRSDLGPAEQFWIIKHGVKLSAMPAWGKTHDDELIWDMVAFVRQLPNMSPEQYKAAIANAPADHEEMMEGRPGEAHESAPKPHRHSHAEGSEHHH